VVLHDFNVWPWGSDVCVLRFRDGRREKMILEHANQDVYWPEPVSLSQFIGSDVSFEPPEARRFRLTGRLSLLFIYDEM
jgi:hypothetical protein